MSADLKWLLVKKHNSFLRKRSGVEFSTEPGNLMNKNSFKFSGLANDKTVDVGVAEGKITVSLKKTKNEASRKPASSYARSQLNKHMRNKSCRGADSLTKLTAGSYYRADLTKFAVARYHALYRSTQVSKAGDKKASRKSRAAKE